MSNEADTCRKFVLPKLVEAGWDNEPHRINEQVTFTDGRIVLAGNKVINSLKLLQTETTAELNAMLLSILAKVFHGAL